MEHNAAGLYDRRIGLPRICHGVSLAGCTNLAIGCWTYTFTVPWRHEIRIEQIGSAAPGQHYPVCVGGARAVPPSECGGPYAFLALRQQYHPLSVIERLLALIDDPDAHDDPYDELRTFQYWAAVNRCERRAINRQLRHDQMVTSETEACA
jgi:hypothetical protein